MAPHATDTFIENRDTTHSFTSRNALGDPDLDLPSPLEDGDLVEPIAVIGFSFKFPQEADSTDSFWKLLMEKRSTATEFPQDRLSVSAFYHPDASRGSTVSIFKNSNRLLYNVAHTIFIVTFPWRTFYQERRCCVRRSVLFDFSF